MKKLLGIVIILMCWNNSILADINLSCVMTNWNTNNDYDKDQFNFEYEE